MPMLRNKSRSMNIVNCLDDIAKDFIHKRVIPSCDPATCAVDGKIKIWKSAIVFHSQLSSSTFD